MPDIPQDELRKQIKEALQEWLDNKYAEVGRWTLKGILALVFVLAVSFATSHGFSLSHFFGSD